MGVTLREVESQIVDFLRNNLNIPSKQIQPGEYGKTPQLTPAVLVFATPDKFEVIENGAAKGQGTCDIFCCVTKTNLVEAKHESIELAEKVAILLCSFPNLVFRTLEFEAVYTDIAVTRVEYMFYYSVTE